MTLIIGIKCTDGIVVGSDGAATLGSSEQFTARQPTQKLTIIGESVIFGVAGPVGLAQRLSGCMDQMWKERSQLWEKGRQPWNIGQIMDCFRSNFWRYIEPEYKAAAIAQQCIGPAATLSARCQTLAALPIYDSPYLMQFDSQASPEYSTKDLPFVAIGSGQMIADPFLAFLREIFWKDREPSVADSIFAAVWTLEHAIRVNPGGIGPPKHLATLVRRDRKWLACLLTKEELQEQEQAFSRVEDYLRRFPLSPEASSELERTVPSPPRSDQ